MSRHSDAQRLSGAITPPPPAQAVQHGVQGQETAIPCEYRYLTDDQARAPSCPNDGTVTYLAYDKPDPSFGYRLRIHFHLCGQHAMTFAMAAFKGEVRAFKQGT